MPLLQQFQGKSQYDEDIDSRYRSSACGPVTFSLLLRYLQHPVGNLSINEIYHHLGTTYYGLFTWRLLWRLRKILGASWEVSNCSIEEVLTEIDCGRPVAAKFDKWFSLKWRHSADFDYHWVPVIGYEKTENDLLLTVHDNGTRLRGSTIRSISYNSNASVLTFIKVTPTGM